MHPRNRHQGRYDLKELARSTPSLKEFIFTNQYGTETIDFSDPVAVKLLNQAMLKSFYKIDWDIPKEFLCPPVPGRADYLHYAADLPGLNQTKVRMLDIGAGANCIYPLLAVAEYNWMVVGSDINQNALDAAKNILKKNPSFSANIDLRLQTDSSCIFKNIIHEKEFFDLTVCNPPFHANLSEAREGTKRKWRNLGKRPKGLLNFGGVGTELFTPGGEKKFLLKMIDESQEFSQQVKWFSTLVSKSENLNALEASLKNLKTQFSTIEMSQGSKKSRILAWTFS
jgi:23S rRNA (adenine1618-N6)-methyltransferase